MIPSWQPDRPSSGTTTAAPESGLRRHRLHRNQAFARLMASSHKETRRLPPHLFVLGPASRDGERHSRACTGSGVCNSLTWFGSGALRWSGCSGAFIEPARFGRRLPELACTRAAGGGACTDLLADKARAGKPDRATRARDRRRRASIPTTDTSHPASQGEGHDLQSRITERIAALTAEHARHVTIVQDLPGADRHIDPRGRPAEGDDPGASGRSRDAMKPISSTPARPRPGCSRPPGWTLSTSTPSARR